MRIVIDLQACQSRAHANRGIGRYSLSLAKAMARACGDDEIWVALNGEIDGSVEAVRAELLGYLPSERVIAWHGTGSTRADAATNRWRRYAAERVRQDFLDSLRPDVVHVSSLFEGFIDDTVTSVPADRSYAVAVTLYDLIPMVHQDVYLRDAQTRAWYFEKIEALKRADLLMGISRYSCDEAVLELGVAPARVAAISAAVDAAFRPERPTPQRARELKERLGLGGQFVMYTGGIDYRKNIAGLIGAYAKLPERLREGHQLVIVCDVRPEQRLQLMSVAARAGLRDGEVIFTGFVDASDLVALYNLCEVFVFPSLHEGFGLPALEAMACGAPVIGANTSSIPEVIGREDALFDPRSEDAMATKLAQVMTDASFREDLSRHGLARARQFSWEACAAAALSAMRDLHARRTRTLPARERGATAARPRLAFVSPLPPEKSGIADYSAELLPALAEHYEIEAVVAQETVADGWVREHVVPRSVEWFSAHAGRYDRVLYQFGNSIFHGHMFGLLERIPGTVVLHDFHLGGIASHLEWAGKAPGFWTRALYESHGYRALLDRQAADDPERILEMYPCNAGVLENADGIIVHSLHSCALADRWYGAGTSLGWKVIPHLRALPECQDRVEARKALGIDAEDLVVCSFGILGPGKHSRLIIETWAASALARDPAARLIFVGGCHDPEYDRELRGIIDSHGLAGRVTITGYVDRPAYTRFLAVADLAVQLRSRSRGETSGTVLDCMAHAVPVIVNAHGSMAELPQDAVVSLPDAVAPRELAAALERLALDAGSRRALGERARKYCQSELDPIHIARMYRDAIESFHGSGSRQRVRRLAADLAAMHDVPYPSEGDLRRVASGIAANAVRRVATRQLMVDVSELARRDAKSGIQRVVRSVLSHLLTSPPDGYRVEPVFAEPGERYRYARGFTARLLGLESIGLPDDLVDVESGDIFLGLDLALEEVPANASQFRVMRDKGASVYFVVYDLLPLIRADCFPAHAYELFGKWVDTLATVGDGAVCISRAVADELLLHLDAVKPVRHRPFSIGYFHLGADIASSAPSSGIREDELRALAMLSSQAALLMVGTIEPRKGHAQALDAFEVLWRRQENIALVMVGKQGWMTDALTERLRSHPQRGRRLFWFDSASDELLARLYATSRALLVPSEGEGFGLPLIEGAQHGLPIICRDLPVFREIAGDGAFYFSGFDGRDLAEAIDAWLSCSARGEAPGSTSLRWHNWSQATQQLLEVVLGGRWYTAWVDRPSYCFPSYDRRVAPKTGRLERGAAVADDQGGVSLSRCGVKVEAGRYRYRVYGEIVFAGRGARYELLLDPVGLPVLEGALQQVRRGDPLVDVYVDVPHGAASPRTRVQAGEGACVRVERFTLERVDGRVPVDSAESKSPGESSSSYCRDEG
ncbi:MAG: glycosyltransferase [Mizugakiibacter sp.]|uniref:glycosyltransferase n=1 Tax=Mizugakiibacter sp. TaxID=1972610 RepID=UPI0031CA8A32|nr:glycosyltransferase [Xanthomonadaceae bacterium]